MERQPSATEIKNSGLASSEKSGSIPHYHYVDLLRGFAAYAVVICHYRWLFARSPGDFRSDVDLPLFAVLWPFYEYGGIAVQLFWVLSGFVFCIAYGRFGKGLSARTFWVHRFSRLYPLHFLTLMIVAGLQTISMWIHGEWTVYNNNDVFHFVLQLFMASDWFPVGNSFNGPIWSVSIEIITYCLFVVFLLYFGLSFVGALGAALLGALAAHHTQSDILLCFSLFFVGVTIGIVNRWIVSRFTARQIVVLTVITVVGVAMVATAANLLVGLKARTLLIYIGAPALLALFISLDLTARELPEKFRWIGASTYSVYLWHMPIVIAAKIALGQSIPGFLSNITTLAAFIIIVGLLGVWSYRNIEAPAQKWIRKSLLFK